jgi:hypothetical protein
MLQRRSRVHSDADDGQDVPPTTTVFVPQPIEKEA